MAQGPPLGFNLPELPALSLPLLRTAAEQERMIARVRFLLATVVLVQAWVTGYPPLLQVGAAVMAYAGGLLLSLPAVERRPALLMRLRHVWLLLDVAGLCAFTAVRRDLDHPLENIITFTTGGTVILILTSLRLSRPMLALAVGALAAAYAVLFWNFLWNVQISLGAPLLMGLTAFIGIYLLELLLRVQREVERHQRLSRFFAPQVVAAIDNLPDQDTLWGTRSQEVTVMFVDIRGFTGMSEKLEPEAVVGLLNEFFARVTACVFRHGGTVDKYIGDCVMALFGAPLQNADDARRALGAARDILATIADWNAARKQTGLEPVGVGIGMNTSTVLAGTIGTASRMEYTAIGDGVNVASRLADLTKQHAVPVLFPQSTAAGAGVEFECEPVAEAKVRGRDAPLQLFTLKTPGV